MQMKRTEHAAEIASIGLGPVGCPKIRTIEGSNLCRHGAYGKCASVFTRESVQDVFANHSSVYIALFSTASQNIQRSELVVAPQGVRLQEVTYQDSAACREAPARAVLFSAVYRSRKAVMGGYYGRSSPLLKIRVWYLRLRVSVCRCRELGRKNHDLQPHIDHGVSGGEAHTYTLSDI